MPENPTFEQLLKLVEKLQSEIKMLRKENADLKEKLAKYENPKNSRNSSIPPSKDENSVKRTNSLRKKSGLKPGGQKGHVGKTLQMSKNPDVIKNLSPDFCNNCGKNLKDIEKEFVGRRQVIDIPPIKPIVTEYQIFSKHCSCGCTTSSNYPAGVKSPVSYGSNIQSMTAYFHTRQFLPFKRMKEMLNDLFGIPISQGGIDQLLNHFSKKSYNLYNQIKANVEKSPVVGSDETGCKVNSKKYWFWTWQTKKFTFITASANRGQDTVDSVFNNGLPESVLVSDCWNPQLNTKAKTHQICLAHLLREIEYLNQLYKNSWTEKFRKLLIDAVALKKIMNPDDYNNPEFEKRKDIIQRLEKLLSEYSEQEKYKKLNTFVRRMKRLKHFLFVFLYYRQVPPDNNASERAVRNIKVKQKISGQFKSEKGAQRFAVIRSVIDTFIKNKLNVLDSLIILANLAVQRD